MGKFRTILKQGKRETLLRKASTGTPCSTKPSKNVNTPLATSPILLDIVTSQSTPHHLRTRMSLAFVEEDSGLHSQRIVGWKNSKPLQHKEVCNSSLSQNALGSCCFCRTLLAPLIRPLLLFLGELFCH